MSNITKIVIDLMILVLWLLMAKMLILDSIMAIGTAFDGGYLTGTLVARKICMGLCFVPVSVILNTMLGIDVEIEEQDEEDE